MKKRVSGTRIIIFGFIALCLLISTSAIAQNGGNVPAQQVNVIDTVVKYGPAISPTYRKAVCTELVIKVIEKIYPLDKMDKSRIRIITNEDIPTLLNNNSPVSKGVYYALTAKGIGTPVDSVQNVQPGDFVQFWTDTWGHCGIVKSIYSETNIMELYSSFPSTDGYGIQRFRIPTHCYFVRLK